MPYNRNVDINRMRPQVSMPPPQQPQMMRQDDQRSRLAQAMNQSMGGGLQQGLQGPANMMMQQLMKQKMAQNAAQKSAYGQAVAAGPQMPAQGIDAARARLASMYGP